MDLYLDWNGDLVMAQDGNLQAAVGWDQVRQRIIRSMITNPTVTLPTGVSTVADYIWEPNFGFGLGSLVDGDFTDPWFQDLKRRINQAIFADADVDSSIPPSIKFEAQGPDQLWIIIGVTLISGQPGKISIQVT